MPEYGKSVELEWFDIQHLYAYQRQSPVEMTENELVDARGSWGWPAVPVKFYKNLVMWFKR
jgi:hypothetical protein